MYKNIFIGGVMFKKYIDNKQGMITVESLIVFPLTLMIVFVFSAYLFLEFEKSNVVLSSNQMSLDVLSYRKEKPKDNDFMEVYLSETPFTRSIKIDREITFTSEIMPEWTTINVKYKNKSTDYKKFNVLILKDALFDGFVDESVGDN
jgi:hypothetical protein